MPAYDALHFDPPALVVSVMLRNAVNGATISDHQLLMDTGADVTLLPRVLVEQIGVQPVADLRYELMAFDGTKSFALVANLEMVLLNRTFRGRYLLIEAEQGVLGRDVLNHLSLLLDGPRQRWSEHMS